jgi:hypothetical protein
MAKWNTHIIIFGWYENLLMGISSVYYFVFQLPDGTPNNHSLVCGRFAHGRFTLF